MFALFPGVGLQETGGPGEDRIKTMNQVEAVTPASSPLVEQMS